MTAIFIISSVIMFTLIISMLIIDTSKDNQSFGFPLQSSINIVSAWHINTTLGIVLLCVYSFIYVIYMIAKIAD